jgi:hypothetical protein
VVNASALLRRASACTGDSNDDDDDDDDEDDVGRIPFSRFFEKDSC